jgi:hypothetical protein
MIPQGARAAARVDRVANGTAFADIHDGNGNELVHGGDGLRQIRALNHIGRGVRLRPPAAAQLVIGRYRSIL